MQSRIWLNRKAKNDKRQVLSSMFSLGMGFRAKLPMDNTVLVTSSKITIKKGRSTMNGVGGLTCNGIDKVSISMQVAAVVSVPLLLTLTKTSWVTSIANRGPGLPIADRSAAVLSNTLSMPNFCRIVFSEILWSIKNCGNWTLLNLPINSLNVSESFAPVSFFSMFGRP